MNEVIEPAATYHREGPLAVVTMNRPRAMNAVNRAMAADIGAALQRAQADSEVRVILITGAGRAFCAGADLKEMADGLDSYVEGHRDWDFAGLVRHWVDKPLVAAVNGFALGGGTEIVLACDLAVIDEQAMLGLPEVRRGLLAGAGGLLRLQRQVPAKVAAEIVFTGQPITAERARDLGLVNFVAAAGTSLDRARELARAIAENAPLAVQESKRLMRAGAAVPSEWDEVAWALNEQALSRVLATADALEGARAFEEKRAPTWRGR